MPDGVLSGWVSSEKTVNESISAVMKERKRKSNQKDSENRRVLGHGAKSKRILNNTN